jgi:hypothetical protein
VAIALYGCHMLERLKGFTAIIVLIAYFFAHLFGSGFKSAFAAAPQVTSSTSNPPYAQEDIQKGIQNSPSAPPSLAVTVPSVTFSCQRTYIYQGKALDCDSNVQRDGEKLRPILSKVSSAVEELDLYQKNRRTLINAAYLSSLGLIIAVAGALISRPPINWRFPLGQTEIHPGGYLLLGGLGLSVGSFAYGLSLSRGNEAHLRNAVENFNRARPDTPIELRFSTDFNL